MEEITAITPQLKDKNRCNIFLDGRFCCGMRLDIVIKNRLKVGQAITQEALSNMQLEGEKAQALDKALLHISATQKTQKEIRAFLQKKGYLSAVQDYVIEKMQSYNFLNDGEYAQNYVQFASVKKGGRLIKLELKAKGIDEKDIDEALGTVDEASQTASASAILQKYMKNKPTDKATLSKAFKYLLSKGFDYEIAQSALRSFGDLDED